jgi:pimeloyl-ACP methyl ester carboxylesterase
MEIKYTVSDWKGYEKRDFAVGGRESFVVVPRQPRPDARWAWRAEFFGAFDTVDMALLASGWYLAYHHVSDMYGCPQSLEYMREFQRTAEEGFGLNPKTVLFGFSRGGLYSVNYAAAYPDKVEELYLDAPVCDIMSWPGGKGRGCGSPAEYQDCLRIFGLTEETVKDFHGNPVDYAAKVAAAGIPVIIVAGDSDGCVPAEENAYRFEKAFRAAGGTCEMIVKAGCDHHPHSLEDPAQVVNFLERNFGKKQ